MENRGEYRTSLINRALNFARGILKLVNGFPNTQSSRVLVDQLVRSATSIGANIVEAQAASSKKDFTNFLNYALKSGNETKFWLVLAKEVAPSSLEEINRLNLELIELTKMLGASIIKLRGNQKP